MAFFLCMYMPWCLKGVMGFEQAWVVGLRRDRTFKVVSGVSISSPGAIYISFTFCAATVVYVVCIYIYIYMSLSLYKPEYRIHGTS